MVVAGAGAIVVTIPDVRAWLAEDVGAGDVTTAAVIHVTARCRATLLLKEPGTVAGLRHAEAVFRALDPGLAWQVLAEDGTSTPAGPVALLEGAARAILAGERLALNLVGRLSGIATLTRSFVDAVAGTGAAILDTRKTTPGLRGLEKEAVLLGGGFNHRLGLDQGVLIKDNHLALVPTGIAGAVAAAQLTGLPVEIECETLDDVAAAVEAGAARVLLDNMSLDDLAAAVHLVGDRVTTEASGGVTLETVRAVAETGVDAVSIGALTHSARSLDFSLEVAP